MGKRRRFTPELKARVVLELLTGVKTTAQVCREQRLNSQVVGRWKAEFVERATELFAPAEELVRAQERVAELERLVGKLTLELELAKKTSQWLSSASERNGR